MVFAWNQWCHKVHVKFNDVMSLVALVTTAATYVNHQRSADHHVMLATILIGC